MKWSKAFVSVLFMAAMLVIGINIGLGINVIMTRGVPVIHGGGELLLLLSIPACIFVGFRIGANHMAKQRGRKRRHFYEGTQYPD